MGTAVIVVLLFLVFIVWIIYSIISEHIKSSKERNSRLKFLENAYNENTAAIENLTKENKQLKTDAENYKRMYQQIMNSKSIMHIIKVLDDNNSPDITKEKLSRLWDVLPFYPPDWPIRKWIVKRRDCYTCQKCHKDLYYCKEGYGEVHHIKPLSIGGTNQISNLIFLCSECHKKVHEEMFSFPFSRDENETQYDDWTYYKIFRADFKHGNKIDPAKIPLINLDSYNEDEPDTDKYYNISYWEDKLED